jgi:lysophospholipase
METLWGLIQKQMPAPNYLMAHSMGGAIACDVARRKNIPITRLIASAPMMGFAGAGGFLRGMIRTFYALGLKRFSPPGLSGGGALDPEAAKVLTSDPARFDRDIRRNTQEPKLQLAGPTVGWLYHALDLFDQFAGKSGLCTIEVPAHFFCAGREALVSNEATIEAIRVMPHGVCETIDDALHEIYQERDALREPFLEKVFAELGVA